MRMTDSIETSVFFVGLIPGREELDARLRRLGISSEHFCAAGPCREALDVKPCRLLVIDLDGRAVDGLQLLGDTEPTVARIGKLALVNHGDIPTAVRAIRHGAANCLEKPVESELLLAEIRTLLSQTDPPQRLAPSDLTKMEMTVLNLILAGKTNCQAAQALHRSPRTVEVHRSHIMRKLGASGMVDLVKITSSLGLPDTMDNSDSLHG